MLKVLMNEDDLLEMIKNKLKNWTDNEEIIDLYVKKYDEMIDNSSEIFENVELNEMIDNDYINNKTEK